MVVGVLAYGFIAKPAWFPLGAKASSTPGLALPTAKPSGAASSTTPAPLISVEPGGSGAATQAPTPDATAGATSGTADVKTCRAAKAGLTVSYPAAWYTVTGYPDWNCMLFDPSPIKIVLNSELPPVAILIAQDTRSAADVIADFTTNPDMFEVLDSQAGTVDGLDATALMVRDTGNGLMAAGTEELVVVVDRGSRGGLMLAVIGEPGAAFDANAEALGAVISSIKIDK